MYNWLALRLMKLIRVRVNASDETDQGAKVLQDSNVKCTFGTVLLYT